MTNRTTIKQVAAEAGVTIGTVSHVLNGTANVADETKSRVLEAIKKLDYIPNNAARNMRRGNKRIIGFLVPNLSNNYYSLVASSFIRKAFAHNYVVALLDFNYSHEVEQQCMYSLMENVAELIIIVNGADDEDLIDTAVRRQIPVLLVDRIAERQDVPYICFDNDTAIDDAVRYIRERGYQSIGYITEKTDFSNLQCRYEALRRIMQKYEFPVRERDFHISESFRKNHLNVGYEYMKELLETCSLDALPDVFMTSSDMVALGCLKALKERKVSVPEDIGLIGFDDVEIAQFSSPALTTIRQDRVQLADRMWKLSHALIHGEKVEPVVIRQELIIRGTC